VAGPARMPTPAAMVIAPARGRARRVRSGPRARASLLTEGDTMKTASGLVYCKSKISIRHSRLPADVHAPYSLIDQTGRVILSGIETECEAMKIAKDVRALAARHVAEP
jgi:hypothetical protein